ncbi:MAG TPA: stage III sporulation protein AE [Bacillota bacterium]|nr:stage III sporulation protein AE [Bacillota bacterium]HOR85620.1 stage III sporulation protein AE [Bacillota bacterium]HPL52766.1 stage III sporulation protein AE [Bacillota bacterium]
MGKRAAFIIIMILMCTSAVYCEDTEDIMQSQLENLDIGELERYVDGINKESEGLIPEINIKELISGLFRGNLIKSFKEIGRGIIYFFFKEVIADFNIMGKLLILAIFCAILQNLHNAFEQDSIGRLAYGICYIVIIIMAVKSFRESMSIGTATIDKMSGFMQALLPTLLSLLAAVGGISSSAVFQPLIFTLITLITTFIKVFVMQLVLFSAVLSILNNLSESVNISRLATLLKQIAVGAMGLVLTAFSGVLAVQGIASVSIDGATVKTAKFAVDNFIPIVGNFLSEALDAVISCSMILKNGIGIAGIVILILICVFPLIKILSIVLIYKIAGSLIQPILDNQIVQCLNDMSNAMLVLLTCVLAVAVMFFMSLTVIMGVGNMTVMIR